MIKGGKVMLDFEPPKPIPRFRYKCDRRFHVDGLLDLLEDGDRFGFIIIGGEKLLFGVLAGATRSILLDTEVDLPKKHNKGGQSSVRFARLRLEKRHNYLRKIGETATLKFLNDNKPNVKGIIVAGFAELKTEFMDSQFFDPRLKAITLKVVDISNGGSDGFNQAIDLTTDVLSGVKLNEHRVIISNFMNELAKDSHKTTVGLHETMMALEMGAVEKLIVNEELNYQRGLDENDQVRYLKPEDGQLHQSQPLIEWLVEHADVLNIQLVMINDSFGEGKQFCRTFDGIGAILRYPMDLTLNNDNSGDEDNFEM